MTHLLLTATPTTSGIDTGQLTALAFLLLLTWRLTLITLFPYRPHRPCKGSGRRFNGTYFRPCRGCHGTGRRTRLGRRIWNWTTSKETTP